VTEHTNNIKITQPKKETLTAQHIHQKKPVAYSGGGLVRAPPPWPTAVIFVTILGLF